MTKLFGPFLSFGEWASSMGKDIVNGGKDTQGPVAMADGTAHGRWEGRG